jgi:hypothetical protein
MTILDIQILFRIRHYLDRKRAPATVPAFGGPARGRKVAE